MYIYIHIHIIYDIYVDIYIYVFFLYTSVSSVKYDHNIHIIIQIHAQGVWPAHVTRLVEQTITSCSSWGEAMGRLKLMASWDLLIWPEASARDHYMSTKDVERWFNEPILHLLSVNCPYPSYALHSKLLQSCRVRIQIETISSIYLRIIIDIFLCNIYIYMYLLWFNFRCSCTISYHCQNPSPVFTATGCWFTRNVVKHSTQRPWLPNWRQTNSWQYGKLNDLTLVTWGVGVGGGRWKEMICF